MMKRLLIVCGIGLLLQGLLLANNTSDDSPFKIYTSNVEVKQWSSGSLEMFAKDYSYRIKLIPEGEGHVSFALSEITFRSTLLLPNLLFRVQIIGYKSDQVVYPIFCTDAMNDRIAFEDGQLTFRHIYGSIPVWFDEHIDSVELVYSNSHSINLEQSFKIDQLSLLPSVDVSFNPTNINLTSRRPMIAIDASSSMDDKARKTLIRHLSKMVKDYDTSDADSAFTFIEFSTDIDHQFEARDKKTFKKKIQSYLAYDYDSDLVQFTNWSVALHKALIEKPTHLLLITDGWSNYYNGQKTGILNHINDLSELCNKIKQNGTRIIVMTSGLNQTQHSTDLLKQLLNGKRTAVYNPVMSHTYDDFIYADLIGLNDFKELKQLNLIDLVAPNVVND